MATLVARGSRARMKGLWSASSVFVDSLRNGNRGHHWVENVKGVADFSTRPRPDQPIANFKVQNHLRLWLQPGVVTPALEVPSHIPRPSYVGEADPPGQAQELQIHDEAGILGMRAAGQLAARIRDFAGTFVEPGVTTDEIDKEAHKAIIERGAYPSLLHFGSFPKSLSTSVNECICHGIPDSRPLKDGDIVNIDVNVYMNGYHAETSATFICGKVDADVKQFVEVTRDCLDTAIAICGPGVDFREIGAVITDIADGCNYQVVEHVVGHGLGSMVQSDPSIYHYYNYKSGSMVAGQTFTI